MKFLTFVVRHRHKFGWAGLLVPLLALGGCAQQKAKSPNILPPLAPLVTVGAVHYTIRSTGSEVRFLVYRSGPLASFGHNHVIRAAVLHGDVYMNRDFTLSGMILTMPVQEFRVDEPAQRAAEGPDFASQPSDAAISGTLHNMLGPALLDVAHYPDVSVRSVQVGGSRSHPIMVVRISLHGIQRDVRLPIRLAVSGPLLIADGSFEIRQTDFGITPFSILGGGLQVGDAVKIHFHILAEQDQG